MKNIFLLIAFALLVFPVAGLGAPERRNQDMKLPTQKLLESQLISDASTADADGILDGHQGATSAAAATVTSFLAQPDVPRNITVLPNWSTGDVAAGDVVVSGTDIRGQSISETFSFLANASTVVTGAKAFKSITSIVFPAEDSPFDAQWDVGWGNKLGLEKCMDSAGEFIKAHISGTAETVTVTASDSVLASNGFTPTNTPNAARDYQVYYIQNFRCLP